MVLAFTIISCPSDDDGKGNNLPVATVKITGSAVVGETLTADTTGSTDSDGDEITFTYQWYRADDNQRTGETEIKGTNGATYTLTAEDEDKYITEK